MRIFILLTILMSSLLPIDNQSVLDCSINLSTSPSQPNTLITNEKVVNCPRANIFWNYPTNNLTIVFSAPQSKPFQFCLIKSTEIYTDIPVYRLVNGQETLVVKSDTEVCMSSDRDVNTLTLKLVGPKKLKYYGVFIDFSLQ